MALIRTFACTKDKTTRPSEKRGQGRGVYLMVGRGPAAPNATEHRIYMDFNGFADPANWGAGDKIQSIELVVFNSDQSNFTFGSTPKFKVAAIPGTAYTEGNALDGHWQYDDFTEIPGISVAGVFSLNRVQNAEHALDVTGVFQRYLPTKVLKTDGTPCGGQSFTGLKLYVENPAISTTRTELWGRLAPNAALRPYLRVTYDVGTVPPNAPVLGVPDGATAPGGAFEGTFSSAQLDDVMVRVEVRVWDSSGTVLIGTIDHPCEQNERDTATFSVDFPEWVRSNVTYKWDARVFDQGGAESSYAAKKSFYLTSNAPVVVVETPAGTLDTMKNILFRGEYSDADGHGLKSFRVWVYKDDPSPVLWWDSGELAPPAPNTVSVSYGGQPLLPSESWILEMEVTDLSGSVSDISSTTFATAATYTPDGQEPEEVYPDWVPDPDETAASQMTGYNRVFSPWRIVLKAMGANRGPGAVVAVITDAANIGASTYMNSPGEFYFTLPAEHPQIGECEPYQRHYSLQMYMGDQWVERYAGILTDFDATEDEVVFYGIDYFGLLSLAVDERKDGLKEVVIGVPGTGGSKYTSVEVSKIIRDQLYHAKNQTNSTTAFITIPVNGVAEWSAMTEEVSLATPYSPILKTVTGLIASHKAGTGRRSRLLVKRLSENTYGWRLYDNYGKDRPDIRLEYGGLLNGYRIIGFGDFGTVVLGLGKQREGTKILYADAKSPMKVGLDDADVVFGRVSKTALWDDLYDETDLKRRVSEKALVQGKIGKRIALALRVDALTALDGYAVGDNVPVVINRGPVQTDRYGSGLWTIVGVAWKIYPDSHQETILTVTPKEDGVAISGDLIGSNPLLDEGDWLIGYTSPPALVSGKWYLDQTSGDVYFWDGDTESWEVVTQAELLGVPNAPTVSSTSVSGVVSMKVTP